MLQHYQTYLIAKFIANITLPKLTISIRTVYRLLYHIFVTPFKNTTILVSTLSEEDRYCHGCKVKKIASVGFYGAERNRVQ